MTDNKLQSSVQLVSTALVIFCFGCDRTPRVEHAPRAETIVFRLAAGQSLLPKTELGRVLGWEEVGSGSSKASDYNCEIVQEYKDRDGSIIRLSVYEMPTGFDSLKNDYKTAGFSLSAEEMSCFTEDGLTGTYRRYERTCLLVSDGRFVAFTRRNFVVSIISETGYGEIPVEGGDWGLINGRRVASRADLLKLAQIVDNHFSWENSVR